MAQPRNALLVPHYLVFLIMPKNAHGTQHKLQEKTCVHEYLCAHTHKIILTIWPHLYKNIMPEKKQEANKLTF